MEFIELLQKQADLVRGKSVEYNAGEQLIVVNPLTVGQVSDIAPHLAKIVIEGDINTPEEFQEKAIPQLEKFTDPIKTVFDLLIECEFDKLLPVDVFNILMIIYEQQDTQSFTNAIIFMRRLSRTSKTKMIATQKRLVEAKYLTQ